MKNLLHFIIFLLIWSIGLVKTSAQSPAGALHFDGVNDYVSIPNPYYTFSKQLTVEWWVNPSTTLVEGSGIGQSTSGVDNNANSNVWLMHLRSLNHGVSFYVNDGGTWRITPSYPIPMGWHHLVGVADETSVRLYLDGVLVSSTAGISGTIFNNAASVVHFGKDVRYTTSRFMQGSIDEVRIWDRALCLGEILNNKNCEISTGNGLVGNYHFNQGTANADNTGTTMLIDYGPFGLHGTLNNMGLNGTTSNWVSGAFANGTSCGPFVLQTAGISALGSLNVCPGGTVTLKANTGAGYSYQWRKDNADIPGANGSSYNASTTGNYNVVLTLNECEATSNTLAVSVGDNTDPVFTSSMIITTPNTGGTISATSASGAVVNYTRPQASDNCTAAPTVTSIPASGSIFPVGTSQILFTAMDAYGNQQTTTGIITVAPFADKDGDLVADAYDQDDDNDGIKDVSECNQSNFYWSNPPSINGNIATGTIHGIGYTYTSSTPVSATNVMAGHSTFPASYNVPNVNPTIQNLAVNSNTLSFASPMSNPVLVFASIGQAGVPVSITFSAPVEIEWSKDVVQNSPTQITGTEGFVILRFVGTFSSVSFDYLVAEWYCNFAFGADFESCPDTDGDGTPDFADIDSDNDGCSDALEGSANFSLSQIVNGKLTGTVATTGIPTIAGTGQEVGTSQIAAANCSCQVGNDQSAPTITAPATITKAIASCQVGNTTVSLGTPVTSDNCTVTVTNNAPATYALGTTTVTWTAKDIAGNTTTATQTVTITQLGPPVVTSTKDINCSGPNSGSIIGNTTGGRAPFQYQLNSGTFQSSNSFTGLAPGVYSLTVKDADNCTAVQNQIALLEPFCLVAKNDSFLNCAGQPITIQKSTLLGNDANPWGVSVYMDVAQPANGTIVDNGTSITYTPNANFAGIDQFNYTIKKNDGTITFAGNGHVYEWVPFNGITWNSARVAAGLRYYNGMQGYLVTVTSQAEMNFVTTKLQGSGWMGASDLAYEGAWRWVTGPEGLEESGQGRQFSGQSKYGNCSATTSPALMGQYANWSGGEPNDCGANPGQFIPTDLGRGGEHYAHFLGGGLWNDYPDNVGSSIQGYIVEYGGLEGPSASTGTSTATIKIDTKKVIISETVTAASCASALNGSINLTPSGGTAPYTYNWGGGITAQNRTGLGVGNYTVTVTDNKGCFATKTIAVGMLDNTPPVAIAKNITITLNASGAATITALQVNNGSNDACGIQSMSVAPSTFNCSKIGANTVVLTVIDVNNNSSTATAIVTVTDTIAPIITCAANIAVNASAASCDATVTVPRPTTSDNCPMAPASVPAPFNANDPSLSLWIDATKFSTTNGGSLSGIIDDASGYNKALTTNASFEASGFNGRPDVRYLNNQTATVVPFSTNDNTYIFTTVQLVASNSDWESIFYHWNRDFGLTIEQNQWAPPTTPGTTQYHFQTGNDNANVEQNITYGVNYIMAAKITGGNIRSFTLYKDNGGVLQNLGTTSNSSFSLPAALGNLFLGNSNNNEPINMKMGEFLYFQGGLPTSEASIVNYLHTKWFGTTPAALLTNNITNTSSASGVYPVGTTNITWTATDAKGNTSTCNQTVTVTDNVAPVVVTKPVSIDLDASGNASITTTSVNNGSTDNCGIASMTVSPNTFNCASVKRNNSAPNNYAASLINGDDYIVIGDVAPAGTSYTKEAWINVISANCDNIISSGQNPFYIDGGGNLSAGNGGTYGNVVDPSQFPTNTWTHVAVTYDAASNTMKLYRNGTLVSINTSAPSNTGGSNALGKHGVTGGGCNFNGKIDEARIWNRALTAAEILANKNNTLVGNELGLTAYYPLENGPSGTSASDVTGHGFNGSFVNTNAALVWTTSVSPAKSNVVTLTVTDIHGNISSATAQVTVNDITPPQVVTQNISTYLNASGNASITAAQVNNGSADACGIASMTLNKNSFNCLNVGPNTVTLTVTDVNGNSASASAVVTVIDMVAPTAIAQNVTIYLDASGSASTSAAAVNNNSFDNCSVASLSLSKTNFDCSNIGPNAVILTVTDVNANNSTANATVTVYDMIAPTAIAQNVTIYLNASGNASTTAAAVDNGSFDNCSVGTLSLSKTSFNCTNVGANAVILTVTDVNGNNSTTPATVTVLDMIAPTAITQNVYIDLDASGNTSTTAAAVNNGSFDNCAVGTLSLSKTNFDCSNVGSNTVTLTVTDVNGNNSTATATVYVHDMIAPIVITQNLTIGLDANGQAAINTMQINDGSTDNCGIASYSLSKTIFTCANMGDNQVILTVTDVNGNSATAPATITVLDQISPTVLTQNIDLYLSATGSATTTASAVNHGSFDNCTVASISLSKTSFDCSNVGANTVTLTVTDVNGNGSTGIATVTVHDDRAPIVHTQNITVTLVNGAASITAAQINDGSTDNCSISSMEVSPSSFNCGTLGNNTVTLTVTDVNGNIASKTATVFVTGLVPTCGISSSPNNAGTVIGSTISGAAVNQMYMGYGAQSMQLLCSPVGAAPFTYSWVGTGLSSSTIANPIFTPTAGGNYTFTCTVTNVYGCQTTCSIIICVIDARGSGTTANSPKVILCHVPPGNPNNPQTLNISANAVPAHLSNHTGDRVGSCASACGFSKTEQASGDLYTTTTVFGDVDLIVYPNPSMAVFNFKLESGSAEEVSIVIFDISGKVIVERNHLSPTEKIVIDELTIPGVYIAEVKQGSFQKTVKLTKVN